MFKNRVHISHLLTDFENKSGSSYVIAGRVFAKRNMSKSIFADVQDITGRIQIFVTKENIDTNCLFKIGDFLLVNGKLQKTKMGEITIFVTEPLKIISKADNHLPYKITDDTVIINKRYLSILTDRDLFNNLHRRSKIITALRNSLLERGFIEVSTPILSKNTSVGSARPFITKSEYLNQDFYLRGTCEIFLKQLIVSGFEKIFEIGSVFRNESPSLMEFPLLEIEQAFADINDAIKLIEEVLMQLFHSFGIDKFNGQWDKVSVSELMRAYAKIDLFNVGMHQVQEFASVENIEYNKKLSMALNCALIANNVLKNKIIKDLKKPTFIIDYPKDISPLAKVSDKDSKFSERGYLFIEGLRICEVVSEQCNTELQKQAFEEQNNAAIWGNRDHLNPDLLEALSYGFPPTGGVGLNINRLIALILESSEIDKITLFPLTTSKFHS